MGIFSYFAVVLEEARRVASQIVSNPNWRQEPQWQIITQNLKDKGNFD
jgi:ATP-dependent DNA helicase RecG